MEKKRVFLEKFRINSGVLRVARSGSGVKVPPLAARPKLAGWGDSFLMVYRNNTGRLDAGFISVCLETCRRGWVKNVVSMCRNFPVLGRAGHG